MWERTGADRRLLGNTVLGIRRGVSRAPPGSWVKRSAVRWNTDFTWDGRTRAIDVDCIPNDDPGEYGTVVSDAFGFPVCTATVRYPRRGYGAMFGWVQLVRSTDNASGGA